MYPCQQSDHVRTTTLQGATKVFALSLHDSNIQFTKRLELTKFRLYSILMCLSTEFVPISIAKVNRSAIIALRQTGESAKSILKKLGIPIRTCL